LDIVPLSEKHLEDAAALFAACYGQQRRLLPLLPARYEDPSGVLTMLADLVQSVPGVAAIAGGRLCGYLVAFTGLAQFKGRETGAYCPEWGHAAAGPDRSSVYRHMYESLSERWVKDGCLTHAITFFAQDSEVADVWFRNGFGMIVVDLLRSLDPVPGTRPGGMELRRIEPEEAGLSLPLIHELDQHMRRAPVFLTDMEVPDEEECRSWLAGPAHSLWLASHNGELAGYMRAEPPKRGGSIDIVHDPGTISITGAYTRPEYRGMGVGNALLSQVVIWAVANGYQRCSVVFESQNIPGSHFWLRHFQPVCHSLIRRIDERIADSPNRP
jgi:GNAT superfamily N-acetyltransferase